jgi:formate hydrogenlyase subunit 3/multisubunit Na+/H+ antiporter MnhD subunit
MIAGTLLLLILPLAMGGIAYIVLRWRTLSGLLAFATAVLLGLMVITLPVEQPVRFWGERQIAMGDTVSVLGREIALTSSDRLALAFLFFSAAGVFLLAWRCGSQSLLFPVGLGLLSLLAGGLLIRPLVYGALLIEIAIVLSVLTLQAEGEPATRGGLRYLTFSILALPGLLVTHWLLDRYVLTPNETSLLSMAAVLLAISFALLLGVVPFHTWVPAVTRDGEPLASVFVLTVSNGAIWFLLLDFLETYPWLSDHPSFSAVALAAGLAMVVLGGLIAAAQQQIGSIAGYAALVDSGAALIALSLQSQIGLTLVFLSVLLRPFGMLLIGAGLGGLRELGEDSLEALRGVGWRAPWSTAALVVGALSISGFPVSAGFVWRWSLYRALAPSSSLSGALLLILAGGGIMVGVVRALSALLARPNPANGATPHAPTRREGRLNALIIGLAIVSCIAVGLFPQLIAPIANSLAQSYTFFGP